MDASCGFALAVVCDIGNCVGVDAGAGFGFGCETNSNSHQHADIATLRPGGWPY